MPRPTESTNEQATARYLEGISLLESYRETHEWPQLEIAERLFSEATKIDPQYEAARFYLGISQEIVGKHEEAAAQFEGLLPRRGEPDLELLYNAGLSYFHQYRRPAYERASEYFATVIELARRSSHGPETTEERRRRESIRLLAMAALAQVYSHMSILPPGVTEEAFRPEAEGNYARAVETAMGALAEFAEQRNQLHAEFIADIGWGLHNALGHAQMYAGRRAKDPDLLRGSVVSFREALEFDPENYRVLSNLGSAAYFLGALRSEEETGGAEDLFALAEQNFHRVLQIKPHYDFAYYRLAQIALGRKRLPEALKYANLAKENRSEMSEDKLSALFQEIERAQTSGKTNFDPPRRRIRFTDDF
jgi:tetratricopeptide (TPR) repeat protein